jgi:site-specific DNA-methyltransferase (cytosine-N4-specific)
MVMNGSDLDKLGISASSRSSKDLQLAYATPRGRMYEATIEELLDSDVGRDLKGRVQLIFTSPPFPLNRKKKYGNRVGDEYKEWLTGLAPKLVGLLKPNGSIVVEMGNAWEPGSPTMSTLALRTLLDFLDTGHLHLCQQFVCHNPARLPSPAQWVNVERIRVKDSFTHVWWMAPTERPDADNTRVLTPYSDAMRSLLKRGTYNHGKRDSGFNIGETTFLKDNGGAIPPNVLTFSNTLSNDAYRRYCREHRLEVHPAPMPYGLIEFFIKFLTKKNQLVLDPFAGSNSTGAVSEQLGRRWIGVEPKQQYVDGSVGRFDVSTVE